MRRARSKACIALLFARALWCDCLKGAVVGSVLLRQKAYIAHRKCGLMCARCDVFWERLRKRRGASSVEQRETMCKMRRIVQNVGFRAVKIHLFDVKHA